MTANMLLIQAARRNLMATGYAQHYFITSVGSEYMKCLWVKGVVPTHLAPLVILLLRRSQGRTFLSNCVLQFITSCLQPPYHTFGRCPLRLEQGVRHAGLRNVESWLRQWRRNGGVINGASTETILIRETIRQVNPLMTPTQQGIELVNVFNLILSKPTNDVALEQSRREHIFYWPTTMFITIPRRVS